MKKFFLFFCLIFSTILSFAQSPQGITFQAVARDPAGNAAKLRQISVIDRILSGSSNGTVIWEERHELTTNAEGVFTIIIGKGTKLSGSATTFDDIKWDQGLVFFNLKVAVAPSLPSPSWTADANFIDMGTSQFWSVPYALSAGTTSGIAGKEDVSNKSTSATLGRSDVLYPSQNAVKTYVDATVSSGAPDADDIIKGKIKLAGDLGGTADLPRVPALALKAPINNPTFTGTVNGITKAMVGLGNVDNTSDANKAISTLTQAALTLKAPLASPTFTGTPTLPTGTIAVTQSAGNNSTAVATTAYVDAGFNIKASIESPTFTGRPTLPTGTIAVTQAPGNGSTALATTAYVDAAVTSGFVADASTIELGKIQLAGDLGGTASSPTVPGLLLKANLASPTFTGTPILPSTTIAVTQSSNDNSTAIATTAYVDAAVTSGSVADATTILLGKIQLAGDLGGTASSPTVPGLLLKANLASPTFTGTPILPSTTIAVTQSPNDNSTALATTAYVDAAVTSGSVADATTISLGKIQLAGDLGGTASSPTVPGLTSKAPLASPTFTGTPTLPTGTIATTQSAGNNSTAVATTAYVDGALVSKAPLASPTFTGTLNGVDAIFSGDITAATVNGISTTPSDKRLKTDIKPLSIGIEAIMKLNPVSYKKKISISSTDYSIKENGFIAQELQKIIPIVVKVGTDENKLLSVNYISIIPVLTKAMQEQQKQIADQQKQINDLKALVEKLINKK